MRLSINGKEALDPMVQEHNRKTKVYRMARLRPYISVLIPWLTLIALALAYPTRAVETVTPATCCEPGRAALPDGFETDESDPLRITARISFLDTAAFHHISKIHQILSGFHSGLPVLDEEKLAGLIYRESVRYGYDPELIVSVIMTESSFYNRAQSHKGAIGLMQLLPVTGLALAEFNRVPLRGPEALYDPYLNIRLGTQYLASLHERFGDLGLALTAYNHGPTRVAALMSQGEPVPTGYTRKVLKRYKELLMLPAPASLPRERSRETARSINENITG